MTRIEFLHLYGTGAPCCRVVYLDGAVTTYDPADGEVRGTFTLTDGALVGTGGPSSAQKERIAAGLVALLELV